MFNAQTPCPHLLCALPSHLKHWNSWKGLSRPLLCTWLRHPLGICTSAHAQLSLPLSQKLDQVLAITHMRPWTPLFHWDTAICARSAWWDWEPLSKTQLRGKHSVATIAFFQGTSLPLNRNRVFTSSHTLLSLLPVSGNLYSAFYLPSQPGHWILSGTFVLGFLYLVCLSGPCTMSQ